LHPDDVAAGKPEALFSRAEVRDFIDVDALLRGGYGHTRLIELGRQRDAGFDTGVLADMFHAVHRFNDRQFAAYGIDPADIIPVPRRVLRPAAHPADVVAGWSKHRVWR
jgi:Nucleotidyl transferase AbiEii toxin, Type IV TA system